MLDGTTEVSYHTSMEKINSDLKEVLDHVEFYYNRLMAVGKDDGSGYLEAFDGGVRALRWYVGSVSLTSNERAQVVKTISKVGLGSSIPNFVNQRNV